MPWRQCSLVEARKAFVRAVHQKSDPVSVLCARFGISRKTGYKWLARHERTGRRGLRDQSRRPHRPARLLAPRWHELARRLHRRRRTWGARKLHAKLRQLHPRRRRPCVRTLQRWLAGWRPARPRRQHARGGPKLPARPRAVARRPNDIWTLDFKGSFRTGTGQRVHPLTVRDLHSRYLLAVRSLPNQSDRNVRQVLGRVFARYGLPKVIRVDNGAPFAGRGALGLSRLSVWWLRLGIQVEFTRRGHPEDNAGHEQMHGVYQRDNVRPPAWSLVAQQRREARWREIFNHDRPHQALGGSVPADHYTSSRRRLPRRLATPAYLAAWPTRKVDARGAIYWQGRRRMLGRAFGGLPLGFKPLSARRWEVYFQTHLVGLLHLHDRAGLRPAHRPAPKPKV